MILGINQLLYYVRIEDVSIQELTMKVSFKLCETSKEIKIMMSKNSHAVSYVLKLSVDYPDKLDCVFKHGPIAITKVSSSMFVTDISKYFLHNMNMSQSAR